MKEVKYHAGSKVNTMNTDDLKDNLIWYKTTYDRMINKLFCTLQDTKE